MKPPHVHTIIIKMCVCIYSSSSLVPWVPTQDSRDQESTPTLVSCRFLLLAVLSLCLMPAETVSNFWFSWTSYPIHHGFEQEASCFSRSASFIGRLCPEASDSWGSPVDASNFITCREQKWRSCLCWKSLEKGSRPAPRFPLKSGVMSRSKLSNYIPLRSESQISFARKFSLLSRGTLSPDLGSSWSWDCDHKLSCHCQRDQDRFDW